MFQALFGLLTFFQFGFKDQKGLISPVPDDLLVENQPLVTEEKKEEILAVRKLDLTERDQNPYVNQIFKHNILLALSFSPLLDFLLPIQERLPAGEAGSPLDETGIKYGFILEPGQVFAFHENFSEEFKLKKVITLNTKFSSSEGYQSPGTISGDGVCHLASLINWAASKAGLKVQAKVNHQFRAIPGIPDEYGTSIRYSKTGLNSQNQNLYIENTFDFPVEFRFTVNEDNLELEVVKG